MNRRNLRGLELEFESPTSNFTKVSNDLFFIKGLSAPEKLILIYIHSFKTRWILAYTRMAKDLDIRKDTVIRCWKNLIDKQFILVTDTKYIVNSKLINSLSSTENVPTNIPINGTESVSNNGTESVPTQVRKAYLNGTENVPNNGTESVPTQVRKAYLNGTESVPTEEDTKEKDVMIKTNNNTNSKRESFEKINIPNENTKKHFGEFIIDPNKFYDDAADELNRLFK